MQLTVVPNDNVTDGANVYSASMDVLNEHNPFNGSQNDDNGNLVTTTVTNIDADGTYTLSADFPINGKRVLTMSADEIASRQQTSKPTADRTEDTISRADRARTTTIGSDRATRRAGL